MSENEASVSCRSPYELLKPKLLKVRREVPAERPAFALDPETSFYRRPEETGAGEAVISIGGLFYYDIYVGDKARMGSKWDLFPSVRYLPPVFAGSDLNIATILTAVSDEYLPSEMLEDIAYRNARPEFLTAIRQVGIDALAAANPHILDAGTGGIERAMACMDAAGIVPAGLGQSKFPIFEVNGIRIGLLSYTLQCLHVDHYISKKGSDVLLGMYRPKSLKTEVEALRERGAEFVVAYFNCEPGAENMTYKDRISAGRRAAEAGADYVVCEGNNVIGGYIKHETADGRIVPIASAVGVLLGGVLPKANIASIVMRLTLKKGADGKITAEDTLIPLMHSASQYLNPVVPAVRGLYPHYDEEDFETCLSMIREKVEDKVPILTEMPANDSSRILCGGYDITFDDVSASADAMSQAIHAFASEPGNEDRRLVVVTSDIPGAGDEAHRALAEAIGDCEIGLLCCLGASSRVLCEEAARRRRSACFETDEESFTDIIIRLLKPGDRILVLDATAKGRFRKLILPMFGKALDGSDFRH